MTIYAIFVCVTYAAAPQYNSCIKTGFPDYGSLSECQHQIQDTASPVAPKPGVAKYECMKKTVPVVPKWEPAR
jgi:hypothetical protein